MNRTQGVHLSISNKSCFDTKKFYYQGFRFNGKYYNISKKKIKFFYILRLFCNSYIRENRNIQHFHSKNNFNFIENALIFLIIEMRAYHLTYDIIFNGIILVSNLSQDFMKKKIYKNKHREVGIRHKFNLCCCFSNFLFTVIHCREHLQ
jgi:hypothetical protein